MAKKEMTDGEPDMEGPGVDRKNRGGKVKKKKHEHKVHGHKSKARADKKKRG